MQLRRFTIKLLPGLQGQTVRAWMSQQPWEVQWQEGLEIWRQAMTGAINWRPPF
jgi:hypothetical protein